MSEGFKDEVVALRTMLAEQGYEVTIQRLLDILERAMKSDRECEQCEEESDIGLCWECLVKLVEED